MDSSKLLVSDFSECCRGRGHERVRDNNGRGRLWPPTAIAD